MKKKNWLQRILPFFLAAILVFSIFPASAIQQEEDSAPTIVSEEISLRAEDTKHFLNDDGSYTAVVYSGPVHFQDNAGEWQDIDNTLSLDSSNRSAANKATYTPAASGVDISVPQAFADGQKLSITKSGYTIALGVSSSNKEVQLSKAATIVEVEQLASEKLSTDAEAAISKGASANTKAEVIEESNAVAAKQENLSSAAVYQNIFPNADLEYIVLPDMIKENIIVKQAQDAYTYLFDLSLDGLIPAPQSDGSIYLLENATDETPVFVLQAPYMYDAAGEESYALTMALDGNVLTLTADSNWVNDEARTYPVVIDPTIYFATSNFDDLFVMDGIYAGSARKTQELRAGRNLANLTRSYIKMTLPNNIPTGSVVTSASLKLYQDFYYSAPFASNVTLRAYDCYGVSTWNSSNISWNNQPFNNANNGYVGNGVLLDTKTASNSVSSYTFNITSAVKRWVEQGTNRGLMIAAYNESSKTQVDFHSSRASVAANRPSMWFVYSAPSVSPTIWNTNASTATSGIINVTCSKSWTATVPSAQQSWLSVVSVTSTSFKLKATANASASARTATVTVKMSTGAVIGTITVTQLGSAPYIVVTPTSWIAGNQADSTSVSVTSNTGWTVSSDSSWLNVSKSIGSGNSTFTISAEENATTQTRTGIVTVTAGTIEKTVTVTQLDKISALFQHSSNEYNGELGAYAMHLSFAAYNPLPPGLITPVIPGSFMGGFDAEIKDVLIDDGFDEDYIRQHNYNSGFFNVNYNTAAHTIAHRDIKSPDGSTKTLVVVDVRGTAADIEWFTNVLSVSEAFGLSEGFAAASVEVRDNFNVYMEDYEQYMQNECVVLVTGHSLGGSVANLVAASLNASIGTWGQGKVYAYTFGSPTVTNNPISCNNIFNIINRNDFITLIPGVLLINGPWSRHGIDMPFTMTDSSMIRVDVNHAMPTYLSFMEENKNHDFNEMMTASNNEVLADALPRLLKIDCPVSVAINNSNGDEVAYESEEENVVLQSQGIFDAEDYDSGVISWITPQGEKVFFVPYGSDVSDANIVAYDNGTMDFSIETLNGSNTCESKTYQNVALTTGKEFLVTLTENSEYVEISSIRLLIVDDGQIVGEVAENGTETIF